jgi:hypothetical protein
MDFGLAFSYQFKDEVWWKKLLLTGLITLIPFVGPFYLIGWTMEIAGRFAKAHGSEEVEMPEIDFGKFIVKGLLGAVVSFIYAIPVMIFVLPIIIVSFITVDSGPGGSEWIILVTSLCCGGLALLAGIFTGFLSFVALVELQLKDFKAAFNFKRNFGILKNAIVPYLLVLVVQLFVMPILSSLGGIACGLGVLFTVPYSASILGCFLGQAHKTGSLATPNEAGVLEI